MNKKTCNYLKHKHLDTEQTRYARAYNIGKKKNGRNLLQISILAKRTGSATKERGRGKKNGVVGEGAEGYPPKVVTCTIFSVKAPTTSSCIQLRPVICTIFLVKVPTMPSHVFSKATRSISTIHPNLCPVTCGKKMEMTDCPDGFVINRGYLPLCSTSYYRRYSFNSALLFFSLLVARGCHRDPWSGPGV